MKFSKVFFFVFLTLFTLCSCQPENVRLGRKAYNEYFKNKLKDPESFKLYSETYIEPDPHSAEFTIDYGAKNGFGAMDRETVIIRTAYDAVVSVKKK